MKNFNVTQKCVNLLSEITIDNRLLQVIADIGIPKDLYIHICMPEIRCQIDRRKLHYKKCQILMQHYET